MRKLIITLAFALHPALVTGEESLCTSIVTNNSEEDILKISEHEFTKEKYLESLHYFQIKLPKRLHGINNTRVLTRSSEFWIDYRNSLKFIEGYHLKQEAIHKAGKAKKVFCDFINNAEYVD